MIVTDSQKAINRISGFVAVSFMSLYGFALWAVMFHTLPEAGHDIILVLLGALATNVTNICNFCFGGSAPNRAKDSTINTLSTTAAKAQDVIVANAPPAADKNIKLEPGQTASVKAEPTKNE